MEMRWTPARLRHLQGALGEILGRRVTDADLGGMIGLPGPHADRTVRRWCAGPEIPGPARAALDRLEAAAPDQDGRRWIPEYVMGSPPDASSGGRGCAYLVRLWYPRFVGIEVAGSPRPDGFDFICLDEGAAMLIRWLDPPDRERDGEAIAGALSRAAAILEIDQADAGGDDGDA